MTGEAQLTEQTPPSWSEVHKYGSGEIILTLPEGFTANNCIPIATSLDYYPTTFTFNRIGDSILGFVQFAPDYRGEDKASIRIHSISSNKIYYKVIFMRID